MLGQTVFCDVPRLESHLIKITQKDYTKISRKPSTQRKSPTKTIAA